VLRLAVDKAAAQAAEGELVLGADTIVVLDGELLGKPRDPEQARWMLGRIAGREHTVLTGVALWAGSRQAAAVDTSRVRLAPLDAAEIAWYVATGEPLDKAGSYAVQGLGALFVEAITGNYSNVVGLPLPTLRRLFAEVRMAGLPARREARSPAAGGDPGRRLTTAGGSAAEPSAGGASAGTGPLPSAATPAPSAGRRR
jgi:septum formation protein